MAGYKKYISMAVSLIVLPLAKAAISKIIDKNTKKTERDPFTEENKVYTSSHTGRS